MPLVSAGSRPTPTHPEPRAPAAVPVAVRASPVRAGGESERRSGSGRCVSAGVWRPGRGRGSRVSAGDQKYTAGARPWLYIFKARRERHIPVICRSVATDLMCGSADSTQRAPRSARIVCNRAHHRRVDLCNDTDRPHSVGEYHWQESCGTRMHPSCSGSGPLRAHRHERGAATSPGRLDAPRPLWQPSLHPLPACWSRECRC